MQHLLGRKTNPLAWLVLGRGVSELLALGCRDVLGTKGIPEVLRDAAESGVFSFTRYRGLCGLEK